MGNNFGRQLLGGIIGVLFGGLFACTSDAVPWAPDLDKILIGEKAQALAAGKIGKAGGILEIAEGDYAGTKLEVPAGALAGDAVVSIYPASVVDEDLGYRPVGPAIRLAATVREFRADVLLTLPFSADKVSGSTQDSLAFLRQTSDQLATVAGAVYLNGSARAAIRELSDYSIALDLAILSGDNAIPEEPRCPLMLDGRSLQGAISATRFMALASLPSTEQVLKARSFGANGCGFSKGWEVTWFSVIGSKQVTIEVWPGGVSEPVDGPVAKPVCATDETAFKGSANSMLLSEDLYERWGETPEALSIRIRACNDAVPANPSRVRLEIPENGNFIEYTADGVFIEKSF